MSLMIQQTYCFSEFKHCIYEVRQTILLRKLILTRITGKAIGRVLSILFAVEVIVTVFSSILSTVNTGSKSSDHLGTVTPTLSHRDTSYKY